MEQPFRTLANSVKKEDYRGDGILQIIVPSFDDPFYRPALPAVLPPPSAGLYQRRDRILLSTAKYESMWASALYIAISKLASLSWAIESDVRLRRIQTQRWLLNAGAGDQFGWVPFLNKHLRAYLCSSKAIIEIERETSAYGSRVRNIHHLSPSRCQLTGDPQIPVLYMDKRGYIHEMKWWQVGIFSELPEADGETSNGLCAAERAYKSIIKLAAIDQYLYDKITGRRPLAIYLVQGLSTRKLEDVIDGGKEDAKRRAFVSYMGATLAGITSDVPLSLVTIPLAELPDRFNRKEELDIALLNYANALGLDPQDLQPLTGQALGSGAQSQVLDQKSRGRGLTMWRQQIIHFFHQLVLDSQTKFVFSEPDLEDEQRRAEVRRTRAETRKTQIESGEITTTQATNLAVDHKDLPKEFLKEDITGGGVLTDTDVPSQ
jgi:hypothetical protein